jgi:hypothetical protein
MVDPFIKSMDQIEQLTDKVLAENVHIFEINKIKNQKIGKQLEFMKGY